VNKNHDAATTVEVSLNPQQLDLIDRLIKAGAAPDRASLFRRALRDTDVSFKRSENKAAADD
jgi:Arc/MetJ-type ribon-helix-helix transcriptional regulator